MHRRGRSRPVKRLARLSVHSSVAGPKSRATWLHLTPPMITGSIIVIAAETTRELHITDKRISSRERVIRPTFGFARPGGAGSSFYPGGITEGSRGLSEASDASEAIPPDHRRIIESAPRRACQKPADTAGVR